MKNPAATPNQSPVRMQISTQAFENGHLIPERYAYCMPDENGETKNAGNINPGLKWSGAPEGTKSFALIVVDPDVPASFESANQAGKIIPADFPRQDFYHWVLYDIPAMVSSIDEGSASNGHREGGKPLGKTEHGITGPNSYAQFGGSHGGYDGPCPPWNDERMHHYHFMIYALDVETLNLPEDADGKKVEEALSRHVIGRGEIVGTYTNHPPLFGK